MLKDPTFLNSFFYPVLTALGTFIVAMLSLLAAWLGRKYGVSVDTRSHEFNKATVETALTSGIAYGQVGAATSDIRRADIQDQIVRVARQYAIEHAGEALRATGVNISDEQGRAILDQMIRSRLAPAVLAAAGTQGPMSVGAAASIANPAVVTAPLKVE